jgi:circadian clock protein KaiC
VVLFRYFEEAGELRHAIAVVKKRTGSHERAMRELRFTPEGLQVGEPMVQFGGVLSRDELDTQNTLSGGMGDRRG